MNVAVPFGQEQLDVEIEPGRLIELRRPHPPADPLADPVAAVRFALEHPHNYPPLRRALTPDDHVTIVVDEELPRTAALLKPILAHVTEAGVKPEAVTLLCPPNSTGQDWLEELPDEFEEVQVEVHQPQDRTRLSYLAATQQGRKIYLNRSLVEADQLIVLSGRGFDPLTGYSGAEAMIYPQFSDAATRGESSQYLSLNTVGSDSALRQEAAEVAWLLGSPFLVQVLLGEEDQVTGVLGGLMTTSGEGQRLLDESWRARADRLADVVVAAVPGEAGSNDFAVVARALGNAARAVKIKGKIILLSRRVPSWPGKGQFLARAENPSRAVELLRQEGSLNTSSAFLWVSAAQRASVYLLSRLPEATAAKCFTNPMAGPEQLQQLLGSEASCLVLQDADKTLVDIVPSQGQPQKGAR
jgi:nickel-dependent lactate racemase